MVQAILLPYIVGTAVFFFASGAYAALFFVLSRVFLRRAIWALWYACGACAFMAIAYAAMWVDWQPFLRTDGVSVMWFRDVSVALSAAAVTSLLAPYLWMGIADGMFHMCATMTAFVFYVFAQLSPNDEGYYWWTGATLLLLLAMAWGVWRANRRGSWPWLAVGFVGIGYTGLVVVQLVSHTRVGVFSEASPSVTTALQEWLYLAFSLWLFAIATGVLAVSFRESPLAEQRRRNLVDAFGGAARLLPFVGGAFGRTRSVHSQPVERMSAHNHGE